MEVIKREISITAQIVLSLIVNTIWKFLSGPRDFLNFQLFFFLGMTLSLQV